MNFYYFFTLKTVSKIVPAIVLTFIEQHKAELSLRNLKKQPVEDASDEYRLTQFGPSQLKLEKVCLIIYLMGQFV